MSAGNDEGSDGPPQALNLDDGREAPDRRREPRVDASIAEIARRAQAQCQPALPGGGSSASGPSSRGSLAPILPVTIGVGDGGGRFRCGIERQMEIVLAEGDRILVVGRRDGALTRVLKALARR